MILNTSDIMSFTNLTPDVNPDGSRFTTIVISGIRYFYFTFTPTTPSIDVFLTRNIYKNEESITRVFTQESPISLLTTKNLSNVNFPCVFINGQITINRPPGFRYQNTTTIPDFKLNNLTVGNTYILESRTIYNDPAMDFGASIKGLILTYIKSSTLPITPVVPIPLPLPIPPPPVPAPAPVPGAFPPTPSGLVATSALWGVSLTWNSTPQTTRYLIYREGLLISSSPTPNYIDSQVISENPYTYTVSSLNSVGESAQSVSRTITPMFSFTCLIPNTTPIGAVIANSNTRYYYFLFTPITPSIEVTCYNGSTSTIKAITGIYDTTDPSTNYCTPTNLVLGSDFTFGPQTMGPLTIDGLSVKQSTTSPKFSINLPLSDLTKPDVDMKTYILEIASYTPDTFSSDFAVSFKSTPLNYNTVSITRGIPSPYVISYDFTGTSESNYTKYIYPNLSVFQNVKSVLESILTTTTGARGFNRKNDMFVHFSITELTGDTLGRSSLDKWTADAMRSPDFTYEQTIEFNSKYFINGYMTNPANFNGSGSINTIPNINLFNILLHEMIHGLGFFYTTSVDVGWNSFLTDVGTAPWYKGPVSSSALSSYRTYCGIQTLQRIPVEGNYGAGTALSHWDDGSTPTVAMNKRSFNGVYHPAAKYEIMTGFLGNNEYMTGITAGFLKDYGYSVNLVSPYVVAHPLNLMPTASRVKCECMESEMAVVHEILIEKIPAPTEMPAEMPTLPPPPPTIYYVQQFYYTPVYYGYM